MNQLSCHANLWSVSFWVSMIFFIGITTVSVSGDETKGKTTYERLEQHLNGMTNEQLGSLAAGGTVPATISNLQVTPDQLNNALFKEMARRLVSYSPIPGPRAARFEMLPVGCPGRAMGVVVDQLVTVQAACS